MPDPPTASDLDALRAQVSELPWYHSIDLGNGVVTPGTPVNHEMLERGLPTLARRSVLDIGAWDGLYSFAAERRGASRVVAVDHYAWLVDFDVRNRYWAECEEHGVLPDPGRDLMDFARPDTLPGRRGFDLAHQALASRVEPMVADFMDVDPSAIGKFDVVLFLGVLYHLRDPLSALQRVRSLTGGVAVIETEAIEVLGMPGAALLSFTAGAELRSDHTNWFVPTRAALAGMCRAAGFSSVDVRIGPPPLARRARATARRAAEALGAALVQGRPPERRGSQRSGLADVLLQRYRITVHAYP